MGASDFKINSGVRRVLTKHWINTKKLKYSSIGGIVYMRGLIEIMYNAPIRGSDWQGITAEHIGDLERSIKKIPEVKRVNFQLLHWEKSGDGWTKKARKH